MRTAPALLLLMILAVLLMLLLYTGEEESVYIESSNPSGAPVLAVDDVAPETDMKDTIPAVEETVRITGDSEKLIRNPGTITGCVFDVDGAALTDVVIKYIAVSLVEDSLEVDEILQGDPDFLLSDQDGLFAVPALSGKRYLVHFSKEGYASRKVNAHPGDELLISLMKSGGNFEGKVIDKTTGRPISKCKVTIRDIRSWSSKTITYTDKAGIYRYTDIPRIVRLIAYEKEGYRKARYRYWPAEQLPKQIELTPAQNRDCYAVFKSSFDGSIVHTVNIDGKESWADSMARHKIGVTESYSEKVYIIRVKGYSPKRLPANILKLGESIDVYLDPGVTCYGRVVDEYGNPVSGISVHPVVDNLRWKTYLTTGDYYDNKATSCIHEVARTDGDGLFQLQDMPVNKEIGVWLKAKGRPLQRSAVRLSTEYGYNLGDLVYYMDGRVSGRILDDSGNPNVGAYIMFRHPSGAFLTALSGTDGSYEMLMDTYKYIHVSKTGYYYFKENKTVKVGPGEMIKDIRLKSCTTLVGKVYDANENTVPGATIDVSGKLEGESGIMISDINGEFVIEGAIPNEKYSLIAYRGNLPGYIKYSYHDYFFGGDQEVKLYARDTGVVYGRILDPLGKEVCGEDVWVGWSDDEDSSRDIDSWGRSTHSTGNYSMILSTGRWHFYAKEGDVKSAVKSILIPADGCVELNLVIDKK